MHQPYIICLNLSYDRKNLPLFILSFVHILLFASGDMTSTLQKELNRLSAKGRVLRMEAKEYNITHLEIPAGISVVGCGSNSVKDGLKGTVLRCIGTEGENAVAMHNRSSLSGVIFYYPNQRIDHETP